MPMYYEDIITVISSRSDQNAYQVNSYLFIFNALFYNYFYNSWPSVALFSFSVTEPSYAAVREAAYMQITCGGYPLYSDLTSAKSHCPRVSGKVWNEIGRILNYNST